LGGLFCTFLALMYFWVKKLLFMISFSFLGIFSIFSHFHTGVSHATPTGCFNIKRCSFEGKTYTQMSHDGVCMLSVQKLFRRIQNDVFHDYKVKYCKNISALSFICCTSTWFLAARCGADLGVVRTQVVRKHSCWAPPPSTFRRRWELFIWKIFINRSKPVVVFVMGKPASRAHLLL